jgi:hypothetical protein
VNKIPTKKVRHVNTIIEYFLRKRCVLESLRDMCDDSIYTIYDTSINLLNPLGNSTSINIKPVAQLNIH